MPTFCKTLLSLADLGGVFSYQAEWEIPLLCGTGDDAFAGFEGSGIAGMQITIKPVLHVRTQAQSTFMVCENKCNFFFQSTILKF